MCITLDPGQVIVNGPRHKDIPAKQAACAVPLSLFPQSAKMRFLRSREILQHVFIYTTRVELLWNELYGVSTSRVIDSLKTSLAPWTLMLVCKSWCDIVTSIPHLWNTLGINLDHPNSQHGSPRYRRLQYILTSLTHEKPLFLTIMNRKERQLGARDALLELLMSVSHRWVELALALRGNLFQSLSLIAGNLGSLRKLDVKHTEAETEDDKHFLPCNAFQNAPSLRNLIQFGFQNTFVTLALPWPQIRELRTYWADFYDVLRIMDEARDAMEICYLDQLHYVDKGQVYSNGPIIMSKLRRFYMSTSNEAIDEMACHIPTLYDNLVMLEAESIQLSCPSFIPYHPSMSRMVIRTGGSLRVLDLHVQIPPYAIINILRNTPVLETLGLYWYDEELFRALTYDSSRAVTATASSLRQDKHEYPHVLAPALRNLQIAWPSRPTALEALSTMVKTRWNASPDDLRSPVRLEYILALQNDKFSTYSDATTLFFRRLMLELPGLEVRFSEVGILGNSLFERDDDLEVDLPTIFPLSLVRIANDDAAIGPSLKYGAKVIPGVDPDADKEKGLLQLNGDRYDYCRCSELDQSLLSADILEHAFDDSYSISGSEYDDYDDDGYEEDVDDG